MTVTSSSQPLDCVLLRLWPCPSLIIFTEVSDASVHSALSPCIAVPAGGTGTASHSAPAAAPSLDIHTALWGMHF